MFVRQLSIALVFAAAMLVQSASSSAQVFEVIHPDVVEGGWEIEALNGVALDDVEDGEERSVHEFAVGYGFSEFWKSTIAFELANPEGGPATVEAFEWENVLLLTPGHGHDDDDGHEGGGFVFGIYGAVEIPVEGGIDNGEIAVGPVVELEAGPVTLIGNLFIEVPMENEEDPGLAYAAQASVPVSDNFAVGLEAFGTIEEAFGDAVPSEEQEHFIGPAVFFETEVGGLELEPRAALLFGLTEATADAVLSFNLEVKFGAH